MSDAAPLTVLLVDDHAVMRAGFRMILEATGDIVVIGEAADGAQALDAVARLRPDVVFMDVQMPGIDGLEATRRIVADDGNTSAVVVVTTFDRDDYLFQALQAGASGFLLKNAGPEELTAAVRVAAAGDALLAPEVTRRVIERFAVVSDEPAPTASVPPPAPSPADHGLTEREAEVLRLLARALSNAEIARELFIGDATVKTHVSNILIKLGARDRVAAVVFAHRNGLA
ncbi:response regulator transcription factor [Microbacterium sp. NM3R9]|uniref:Response regulator transcription factor n=2 Tax=Microbacterium thalli TaxID=3027921 RepID=A0ABT5SEH5_9MICO|nr:response regulator transcription factor [Microbacterium thalli]MDD7961208.1 response regulator transcription factor [Microbacterium thalli]MDN8549372.1 response regulator transcription factor [Microbacterium thalli]